MCTPTIDSIATYKQHIVVTIATLDQWLSSPPPSPSPSCSHDIEGGLASLNNAYSALRTRSTLFLKEVTRTQKVIQALISTLKEGEIAHAEVWHAIDHHRTFIASLARRIDARGAEDTAAPPSAGTVGAEVRQAERFKLIRELAVAGEDFVRMKMSLKRFQKEAKNLREQITEGDKAANEAVEAAKSLRQVARDMKPEMLRVREKAKAFGCAVDTGRMVKEDEARSRGEEVVEGVGGGSQGKSQVRCEGLS